MKSKKLFLSVVLLLSMISIHKVNAQVTVGSNNPAETYALLQIKETQPTAGEETVTTGGFLLPRVKLTDLSTLSDLDVVDPTLNDTKREHTGLLVFNVNTTTKILPGLYVWDGNQWIMLIIES